MCVHFADGYREDVRCGCGSGLDLEHKVYNCHICVAPESHSEIVSCSSRGPIQLKRSLKKYIVELARQLLDFSDFQRSNKRLRTSV